MKKITLILIAFFVSSTLWTINAQTYSGSTGAIPDNTCASASPTQFTANVTDMGVIGTDFAIANVTLNISHTWASDLDITLIAPSGQTLDLSSDNGVSGDNYINTVFQDGNPSITTGTPPFTGTFQAEGGTFAAAFIGATVNGNWILRACDDGAGIAGIMNSWSITFSPLGGDPPVITCPANITADSAIGQCGAVVNFAGSASDTEDGNISGSITYSPASGSLFPVGTTTVTASVTDSDGNTVTCDFDVSNLASGVYMVQVQAEGVATVKRLVRK